MERYMNPIPDPDDEMQSRTVMVPFTFSDPVTAAEAAENINEYFRRGNVLSPGHVRLTGAVGICYRQRQPSLGRNDRDPDGYGPRASAKGTTYGE